MALEGMKRAFMLGKNKRVVCSKKIGSGGFGFVWLAKCDGVEIALKELRTPIRFTPRTQSAKDALAPMPLQEAAIQSLMVHTNIASIFWADVQMTDEKTRRPLDLSGPRPAHTVRDTDADSTWAPLNEFIQGDWDDMFGPDVVHSLPDVILINMRIAMEFCEKGCLADYLAARPDGTMPQPLYKLARGMDKTLCAVLTSLDIAKGLRLMHKTHIVHGDLKPHNILLGTDDTDARGFVAKLSDFGLSARLEKQKEHIDIKNGTVPYLPQEALENLAMSKKTDVYAFGLLMWEIWHNRFWARIYDLEKKTRKCSNRGMYGFKPECRMDCPQEYADIVAKCLSTDPSERPSFKELVVKLEECMHLLHSASLHGASTDDSPVQ